MSLVAAALRIITVQAIKDATFAQGRVVDSAIDPIDVTIQEDAAPIVTVNTDDEDGTVTGRDLLAADQKMDLVLEMAVARKVTVTIENKDTGEEITEEQIHVPHTDAGLEFILNMMGRQITRALLVGNKWSDLWRLFVCNIETVATRRGASVEKGARYAARQITMRLSAIAEPSFAPIAEGSPWATLLAYMREVPDLVGLAGVMEAEITAPTLTDWRRAAADLGLRDDGASRIGLGSMIEGEPDAAPPLDEVEVEFEGGAWIGNNETVNGPALPPEGD